MARVETDREDLFEEATACRERWEFNQIGPWHTVFVGIRHRGAVSFYFDADPVYHLDDQLRLRRSFCDGALYRSEGAFLSRLIRERTESESTLLREDFTPEKTQLMTNSALKQFEKLEQLLVANQFEPGRQTGITGSTKEKTLALLETIRNKGIHLSPALTPR